MKIWTYSAVVCLLISYVYCQCWPSSLARMRQNIMNMCFGALKFNDSLPYYKDDLPDTTPTNGSEYDFIIIGAGAAGATLASRLSEVEDAKVLLIEAGIKEYPIMDIPKLVPTLQFSDQVNWKYRPERSDKFCRGMKDGRCKWPRGKVVGGSSVLNYMMATRGHPKDYNQWAEVTGDESWNYDNMLYYLKKLEHFVHDGTDFDKNLRNEDGPLYITPTGHGELTEAFIQASQEIGLPNVDFNSGTLIGASFIPMFMRTGERWSVNRGYLHPAKGRTNLFLTTESHVNRILIDEDTKWATGVHFTKGKEDIVVMARKEVILSAGSINSPQILMLSGIGPERHLTDLGIKPIRDAPVGENLADHILYGGLIFKTNHTLTDVDILDPRSRAIRDYMCERSGPLATGTGFDGMAFLNAPGDDSLDDYPEIELLFTPSRSISDQIFSTVLGIADTHRNKIVTYAANYSSWSILPTLSHPKSRGKILLQSKNPKDKPIIYANYLDHPDDVKTLIDGVRAAIRLSKTTVFQKYGSELYDMNLPCDDHDFDSDDYWECAIRTYTFTVYHPLGTCKMGKADDVTSVVDPDLKVNLYPKGIIIFI